MASTGSPEVPDISKILSEYQEYLNVFSKTKASGLYTRSPETEIYIVSSTSPSSASFFFVEKDYRGLKNITIKYPYPLPLVPGALEQLQSAKIFLKLHLKSAYNLVRIRKGDKWKTAFSRTSGHYMY